MKIIIMDMLYDKMIEHSGPEIPRKGDCINFGYSPAPIVDDVVWDFQKKTIYVICNKR